MQNEKHITGYSLQYWLYAILNKEFGKEVRFIRDSLHRRYSVNRHCFDIESDTIALDKIVSFLNNKLSAANYIAEKDTVAKGLMKTTQRNHGKEQLYVHVQKQQCMDNTNKVSVSVFAYWTKKN